MTILPRRHRGHREVLHGEGMLFVNPGGMQVTGYGSLPVSGQNLLKAFLCVLSASSEAGGE